MLADEEFQRAKATSKRLLEVTKAKMEEVSDEMRQEFQSNYVSARFCDDIRSTNMVGTEANPRGPATCHKSGGGPGYQAGRTRAQSSDEP
jgi:hypothetical protein